MKKLRIRFHRNAYGNLNAYAGRRRIASFGERDFDAGVWAIRVGKMGHSVDAGRQAEPLFLSESFAAGMAFALENY